MHCAWAGYYIRAHRSTAHDNRGASYDDLTAAHGCINADAFDAARFTREGT
jgi:hypothetical protein